MLYQKSYHPLDLEDLHKKWSSLNGKADLNKRGDVSDEKIKVLFVYPHPDDETMASGGLLNKLANNPKYAVTVLTLTKGEHGDEILKLTPSKLAKIREAEWHKALAILGSKRNFLWNYPDGGLRKQVAKLTRDLRKFISNQEPDIVVTYEKFGLYGHPDHVVLSKLIKELATELKFLALYNTVPKQIAKLMKLPVFMADDPEAIDQVKPEFHLRIMRQLPTKYKAARAYQSQNLMRGVRMMYWPVFAGSEYYSTKWSNNAD